MNKQLEELSKPVAWVIGEQEIADFTRGYETFVVRGDDIKGAEEAMPLYSQEYVDALLAEMAALRAIAEEYRDLMHHMDAGGDFYQFQRDKAGEK